MTWEAIVQCPMLYLSSQRFYGWREGDKDSAQAWDQYQEALTQKLNSGLGQRMTLLLGIHFVAL